MQIGVVFQTTTIDPVTQAFLVEAWDRQSEEFCKAYGIPYIPVVLYDTIPDDQVAKRGDNCAMDQLFRSLVTKLNHEQ